MPLSRRHAAPTLLVGLLSLMPAAGAAPALPFEPVPSSFQTWLNNQPDWPKANGCGSAASPSASTKRPVPPPTAPRCSPA